MYTADVGEDNIDAAPSDVCSPQPTVHVQIEEIVVNPYPISAPRISPTPGLELHLAVNT